MRSLAAFLVAKGHRRYDWDCIRWGFSAGISRPFLGATMTLRATALRLPLLLATLALASACSSEETGTETEADTATGCNLFTGEGCEDTGADTGADTGTEDTTVDPDGSGEADGSGDSDTTPTGAAFGEPCEVDSQCASGLCLVLPDGSICTQPCAPDCPEGFACAPAMISTAPATDTCAPSDFCEDTDGDTFGRGPACAATDCDDDDCRDGYACDDDAGVPGGLCRAESCAEDPSICDEPDFACSYSSTSNYVCAVGPSNYLGACASAPGATTPAPNPPLMV